MDDTSFMKGLSTPPLHLQARLDASPTSVEDELVKGGYCGICTRGHLKPGQTKCPHGKPVKGGAYKTGEARPVNMPLRHANYDKVKKSTTQDTEKNMSTEFEDIFKSHGAPKGGKKSGTPKPAAAQKRASRPGNEVAPTRGGQKGQVAHPRGGAKGSGKPDTQMGGRPKKDPSTVSKAFPVIEDKHYRATHYVHDTDPSAPKA